MHGKITSLKLDRCFGFIEGDEPPDYFFHRSDLDPQVAFNMLRVGDAVEFDREHAQKGPRAVNVRLA